MTRLSIAIAAASLLIFTWGCTSDVAPPAAETPNLLGQIDAASGESPACCSEGEACCEGKSECCEENAECCEGKSECCEGKSCTAGECSTETSEQVGVGVSEDADVQGE